MKRIGYVRCLETPKISGDAENSESPLEEQENDIPNAEDEANEVIHSSNGKLGKERGNKIPCAPSFPAVIEVAAICGKISGPKVCRSYSCTTRNSCSLMSGKIS